jgi:hypothetical protein
VKFVSPKEFSPSDVTVRRSTSGLCEIFETASAPLS